jgi:pimeloyl-ACP methyl ester carboxylesterase
VARPLSASELFPAGRPDITTRSLALTTGIHVRVAESGARDAEAVVMLHGWGASLYTFRHAMSALASRGFHVIAVDMRGYGLADHPRARGSFTTDAYMSDLISLLDVLALPCPALVGHSMGGAIALHLALREPSRVRALALVNPAGLVPIPIVSSARWAPRSAIERVCDRRIPRWLVGQILRRLAFSNAGKVTERDVDEYWSPTRMSGYIHAVRGSIDEFDWRPVSESQARALAVPAVVILGEQDRLIRDARSAADRLSNATVVSLSGGHCVHEERPEVVYPLIGDFLGRWK